MHLLNLPITIKWTCYGAMVSGKEKDVLEVIEKVRRLDPYNIFTKSRGFPPGDPRRCRGHRFGPREGFHKMEDEFKMLNDVSDALKNPKDVYIEKEEPMDIDELKKIFEEFIKKENSNK